MKGIKYCTVLICVILTFGLLFTSCGKDNNDDDVVVTPFDNNLIGEWIPTYQYNGDYYDWEVVDHIWNNKLFIKFSVVGGVSWKLDENSMICSGRYEVIDDMICVEYGDDDDGFNSPGTHDYDHFGVWTIHGLSEDTLILEIESTLFRFVKSHMPY